MMSDEKNTSAKKQDVEVFQFPEKEVLSDHYEIMLLVSGDASEEEAEKVYEEVKKLIAQYTGEITLEVPMGRKSLAYRVEGSRNGTYFLAEFNMEKRELPTLNEKLRIRKDLARYLIVKKREKSEAELAEEQRVREKIEARKKEKMNDDISQIEKKSKESSSAPVAPKKGVAKAAKPATKAAKPVASKKVEEKAPASPTSLEDIDKEIEKILSDDIEV